MAKEKLTAQQIAQWFINRSAMDVDMFDGEYVTNMKLQKLLYFAQGLSIAIFGKKLFEDKIEAWQHGPVVHSVYSKYSRFANNIIPDVTPIDFDEDTSALLEFVFEKYGIYTASQLRNMTHNQKAYTDNFVENKKNVEIPVKDIEKEFNKNRETLIKEFSERKSELMDYAETCYINSMPDKQKLQMVNEEDLEEVDWKNEL